MSNRWRHAWIALSAGLALTWAVASAAADESQNVLATDEPASSSDGQFNVWRSNASGRGAFRNDQRHGRWTGEFVVEGTFFAQPPFEGFQGPFTSVAHFQDGQLHGECTFHDQSQRPVCTWNFDQGEFHGKAVWWYPGGQMRRQAHYQSGLLDGELTEWTADGRVLHRETYAEGLKVDTQVEWHTAEQKRMQGSYVHAGEVVRISFDWWTTTLNSSVVERRTRSQRTGRWTWWYANGQKELEGHYERDVPVGKFTWWYPTGQKQREGEYAAGRQSGRWRSWHLNGLKQTEAEYGDGELIAPWTGWHSDGRIATSSSLAAPTQTVRR
jgi:antitoxin component YwqK of YwqJK toxin-antitoxin module